MKFNKWTLGLAAVGAVSMASAVRADEAKLSQLQTALSNTTISGVVDVGYQQSLGNVREPGSGYYMPNYGVGTESGFSLNQVIISIDKPLDETPWAAGYHVDLQYGDVQASGHDSAIRQAYVALRMPVGNGIDWKLGVIDGITGYEGNTLSSNPNYTRSYGYALNPDTLTGAIAQYKVTDWLALQAGFVNRDNGYGDLKRQQHNYVGAISLTAPESFGFLKGSTLNAQTIQGFDNESWNVYSANMTLNTPVAGLKFGFAFDRVQSLAYSDDGSVYGVYASYQATEKLSFAVRGEYLDAPDVNCDIGFHGWKHGEEVTATIAYNLWANVISRVEFRWDHSENETAFNAYGDNFNAFMVAANIAYKF